MQSDVLLKLGDYKFSVSTATYQELKRSTEFRWASADRLGRTPALQYVGPGQDQITLSGVIYPEFFSGPNQIEQMRNKAAQGRPLLLVDGLGHLHGYYAIKQIEETQSYIDKKGVPLKQTFTLSLLYYGEDDEIYV